jgi:alkylation response protein AidB-like acyl-CoA dehydrogenase
MHLELSDDQQILKQAMREFAVGEIAPGASERDEHARFPSELIPKLAEQGLLGITVPEQVEPEDDTDVDVFLVPERRASLNISDAARRWRYLDLYDVASAARATH